MQIFLKQLPVAALLLLSSFTNMTAQYIYPDLQEDTTGFGQYIQRSMSLMDSSTPEKRNTVRVMVYGQSLSEQSWSDSIHETLLQRFPDADIVYKNRSVGGFSSQILWQITTMDMLEFYPDLVIFHVFGHHMYYDTILQYTLENTAAEMAIWTDPHEGSWSDQMSYTFIPGYTNKYNLELMQIRDEWADYLAENNYTRDDVTRDGTHLNDRGNFLLANLLKPYFFHKTKWQADPAGRVVTLEVGKDIRWINDTLWLPFAGNRVDAIAPADGFAGDATAEVWVDEKRPSEIPELYNMSRPNEQPGGGWVWNNAAFVRAFHTTPWENEHWVLVIDSISDDQSYCEFNVTGSLTGPDGSGNNRDDFISNSGKVIIHGGPVTEDPYWGAWHIKRTHDVNGMTFPEGTTIEWDTYLMGMDSYAPQASGDGTVENATTLFKGLDNTYHLLALTKEQAGDFPLESVRIYRPTLKRGDATATLSADGSVSLGRESGSGETITLSSDTDWFAGPLPEWVQASTMRGTGNAALTVTTTSENTSEIPRTATLIIYGNGTDPVQVEITQAGADPAFAVSDTDTLYFTADASSKDLVIRSNSSWSATMSSTWMYAEYLAGSFDDTISVSVDENTGTQQRTGAVYLAAGPGNTDTVRVVQEGKSTGIIQPEHEEIKVHVYPNPASGNFYVDAGNYVLTSVEICDLTGRTLYQMHLSGQGILNMDVGRLEDGVYLIRYAGPQINGILQQVVKH